MCQKMTIVPLEDIMDGFLTLTFKVREKIPNIFTNVPKFSSEREMYNYIVSYHSVVHHLLRLDQCPDVD